ncbi:MAG: IS3 family transposase [Thermoplasmata archaeon]
MRARGLVSRARGASSVGLSRRSLYYRPVAGPIHRHRADDRTMRARVRAAALAHPVFGYRRVWATLRARSAVAINIKRVRRILREESLMQPAHYPRPRLPETGRLVADHPNERWAADITYVMTTDAGPVPLIAVLDACTREVVGHELLRSCGAADALAMLSRAVMDRFPRTGAAPGLVLVTDGGSQFVAHHFQDGVRRLGIALHATRKRRPEDNGLIESWNGHFKHDYLWTREPDSFVATRQLIEESVKDYNEVRPHSSLNYRTPAEYGKMKMEESRA